MITSIISLDPPTISPVIPPILLVKNQPKSIMDTIAMTKQVPHQNCFYRFLRLPESDISLPYGLLSNFSYFLLEGEQQ